MNQISLVNISEREYQYDEHGNLHQLLSGKQYFDVLDFYREHLYFAGHFRDAVYFNNRRDDMFILDLRSEESKAERYAERVLRLLPASSARSNVLELGCGSGSLLRKLHDHGFKECEGWEISDLAKFVFKQLWGSDRITISNVEILNELKLTVSNPKYDLVIAFDVVEHVLSDILLLKKVKNILNKEGLLILEIPLFRTSHPKILHDSKYLFPEHHLHLYCHQGFCDFIKENGWFLKEHFFYKNGEKGFYALGMV